MSACANNITAAPDSSSILESEQQSVARPGIYYYKEGHGSYAKMDQPSWSRAAAGHREFLRTYKACISCRLRKAKCELGGNAEKGVPPGPPCMRCRREQRSCQFTETRAWARKKKKGMLLSLCFRRAPRISSSIGCSTVTNRWHFVLDDVVNGSEAGGHRPFEAVPGRILDERQATSAPRSVPAGDPYYPRPSVTNGDIDMSQPYQFSNISPRMTPRSSDATTDHDGLESPSDNESSRAGGTSPSTAATCLRSPETVTGQKNSGGLANSVMRPVVSSGNDALNILFQAAAQEQAGGASDLRTASQVSAADGSSNVQPNAQPIANAGSAGSFGTAPPMVSECPSLSKVEPEILDIWDACRFVHMGWFSSREAVTYIDLFFRNMAPLSPIISDFYANHRNHYWLITQEPVLCCTVLMISSRYHLLPGVGGASRGFFIHQSLWQHCQQLIMRVMFGQEKGTKAKTRTIGTIEALLIMSEWHPRSLHFPPQSEGWESDLMLSRPDTKKRSKSTDTSASSPSTWLEDVIEPARRSDRMSWMLLGSALTLAHELGVFDSDDSRARSLISCPEVDGKTIDINVRRQRVQQLLYVFINQLASRLGCMSLMPQGLNHSVLATGQRSSTSTDEWSSFMTSWIELTKLVKSVTDMFFPSATLTHQQLHNGRYIGLLDHFRPLLLQWRQKYLDTQRKFFLIPFILFGEFGRSRTVC